MSALPLYSPEQDAGKPAQRGSNGGGSKKPAAVCGVRYGAMNWVGEFRLPAKTEVACGAHVVVQTDRGIELGEQLRLTCPSCKPRISRDQIKKYVSNTGPDFYRARAGRILREASRQDVDEHQRLNVHVHDDVQRCREAAAKQKLAMKIITAEHLLGGERIVFYFRSEQRVDFRELVRELAQYYQTRIEMRQVGARDEARLIADYEVCGRECCCKNFLKKLRPVTMRMAKLQKSTLDPSKVSGRCGRLRCCLRYEHEGYNELSRNLPRLGARVGSEFGTATVIDRQVLTQLVLVRLDDGQVSAVPVSELSAPDTEQKPRREARRKAPVETPKPEQPEPEKHKSAPQTEESEQAQQQPARSRRRSRRRRRRSGDASGQTPDKLRAAPASRANGDAKPGEKTKTNDASKDTAQSGKSSRRRRRRKRRPGRGKSDGQPDSKS